MNVWPFPFLRNHSTANDLTALFERFLAAEDFEVVDVGVHETSVKSKYGHLTFWSANCYYAYAQSGEVIHPSGKRESWVNEMPSRAVVRKMARKTIRPRFQVESA